jgi:hypothetical protein
MCGKIKLHYWECGHRLKGGIKACLPWEQRMTILDERGRCPNDYIIVERREGKCDDCMDEEEMAKIAADEAKEKAKGEKK